MFEAQLSKQDYLDYCKAIAEPLTEECRQLLAQARTQQLLTVLLWGGALLAVVLATWFVIKALKRRQRRKAQQ